MVSRQPLSRIKCRDDRNQLMTTNGNRPRTHESSVFRLILTHLISPAVTQVYTALPLRREDHATVCGAESTPKTPLSRGERGTMAPG